MQQIDCGIKLTVSILLLRPQGCRWPKWLAGRGVCTESRPELETANK